MTADDAMHANYDPMTVEQVTLEEAIGLHPEHVTVEELCLRIVSDPEDSREMYIAREAIRRLRRVGLFWKRKDGVVKPTAAGVRARELLAGPICISLDSD